MTCIFYLQEQRSLKAGDLSHQESNNMAASTMKLKSESFTSEKVKDKIINWLFVNSSRNSHFA